MAKKSTNTEITRRYVTAVYELSVADDCLAEVTAEIKAVADVIAKDADLKALVSSPITDAVEQSLAIKAKIGKLNLHQISQNLLVVAAKNRRLALLPQIADQLAAKLKEDNNEAVAEVAVSESLSAEENKNIAELLSKKTKKKVTVKETLDKSLMGGMIIKIGSKMADLSVKGRLAKIKKELLAS